MTIHCIRPARVNPLLEHPQEQRIRLDGEWGFRLDPQDCGVRKNWFRASAEFADRIRVPGCWQGQGFGGDGKDRVWDFNLEARVFRATYKGTGWYGRSFAVPAAWRTRRVWLNFGGAHPSAEVWLNGIRLGENALPFVPFGFDISGVVRHGDVNDLAVRVHEHNREYGFSFSWQGNWSGLYRGVDLVATGPAWLERCALLPDLDAGTLTVRVAAGSTVGVALALAVSAVPLDASRSAVSAEFALQESTGEFQMPMPQPLPWSPDAPALYRVDLELRAGGELCDVRSERVGFVKLEACGKEFRINGEPYYLRGSGDFISCPETGCPDTDRERWRRKLRALRDYGYNYVRCQSYVYGPEYYDVADELGILVQSEMGMLGAWGGSSPWHVYQWPKPTPDHYPTLKQQWDLVVERDACHPSANLYCMSNEYWGNTDFPRVAWQCYRDTKALKPGAFVIWTDGGYNKELPGDFINHGVNAFKPEELAALGKPLIQHEYQWWSSFPDVRLRAKYTGAVRPYAAEIAAETAARRGQAHLLETYAVNSQRLQFIEAKAKMEAMRRDNPALAGINHFNAMDANPSPQGIIDEFYERKFASAATWLQTNGDTVVFASLGFADRCWTAGETVTVRFSISDFAHPPFRDARLEWRLVTGAADPAAEDGCPADSRPPSDTMTLEHATGGPGSSRPQSGPDKPGPPSDTMTLENATGGRSSQTPAGPAPAERPSSRARRLRDEGVAPTVLAEGVLMPAAVPFTTAPAGEVEVHIPAVTVPTAAVLHVRLTDGGGAREVRNAWPVWLFPESAAPTAARLHGTPASTWLRHWCGRLPAGEPSAGQVVLTEQLDAELIAFMQRGGRVILAAGEGLVRPHGPLFGYVRYFFTPPANYSPYEDGQNGTVIAAGHPMLGDLPHAGFADWQFFRVMENAPPLDLEPLGLADGDPVIRVIHRYPTLHPLAYLVERRVGDGGLILCALELNPDWIEARGLLGQLCTYAGSSAFPPVLELRPAAQARLLAGLP